MRHFPLPVHAAVVAATVVAGLASYQGVDKLVLALGGSQYETAGEPGHEPSSSTTTTVHHEPTSSTSTTAPHSPDTTTPTTASPPTSSPPTSSPPTTEHHGGTTPPTTTHKSPEPTTSTTVHHEPTPTTTTPAPTGVEVLTLRCGTVALADGRGAASCSWSQSTAPNFYMYAVSRELVGTPSQVAYTTQDRTHNHFGDTTLVQGSQYSYIVWAYDAAGNVVGRSGPLHVNCCDGTVVST